MVEQTGGAYPVQTLIEAKVKDYLEHIGFFGIEQHGYMNYAQELWARSRSFTGATLTREAEITAGKWLRRGLLAEHLIAIARMFGVTLVV